MVNKIKLSIAAFLGIFCISTLLSLAAFADSDEPSESRSVRDFRKVIQGAQNHCPRLNCNSIAISLRSLNSSSTTKLKSSILPLAEDLSQIWGDTILEGDVEQKSEVRLEKISEVIKDKTVIGYRFTYSAIAIDWSKCPTNHTDPLSKSCEGKISESGFAPVDLKGAFADPYDLAQFEK